MRVNTSLMNLKATLETLQTQRPTVVRYTVVGLVAVAAILAIATMPIVNHDTGFFSPLFAEVFRGDYAYYTGDYTEYLEIGGEHFEHFINMPHSAFLLPFLGNPYWASFWVAFGILLVLTGDHGKPIPALTRLVFMLSAYLLYPISPANLFFATAFGLLLFLQRPTGWLRGFVWALFLVRPQDALLWLAYDGILALRDRDWKAFVMAGAVVLLPILRYGPGLYLDWFATFTGYARVSDTFTPIDFSKVYGLPGALLFCVLIGLLRAFRWDQSGVSRRRWAEISFTEKLWLMSMLIYVTQGYGTYTMLWLIIIPIREMPPGRILMTFVVLTGVSLWAFVELAPIRAVWGVLTSIFIMALIIPRSIPQSYRAAAPTEPEETIAQIHIA
jgi:hypothetical protein